MPLIIGGKCVSITAWLRGLGLEQYAQAFVENGVDAEVLPRLTTEDFDIGVNAVGDWPKSNAIAALELEGYKG
jgi:hypothetical protein